MQEQQKKLVERLKQAQNVLVTVSKNPSVDQLAAAIGLTLALNHVGKHATAVFSGEVPSTLEFLKPEQTLEKNTDSLRDFIIALDKSKADKLRYKVEDNVVRIFITPYRTSITDKDLEFSQGDFNVEVVIALGVPKQQDLDEAITAHGRILHDATVAAISTQEGGELGSINLVDTQSSSLSEMVVNLIDALDKKALDNQMATALLTGIVSATERFRNEKTSPKTMSASAALMAAGANQQLVASQLENPEPPVQNEGQNSATDQPQPENQKPAGDPGMLEISHNAEGVEAEAPAAEPQPEPETAAAPQPEPEAEEPKADEPESNINPMLTIEPEEPHEANPQVHVDENGQLVAGKEEKSPKIGPVHGTSRQAIVPEPNVEPVVPEMDIDDAEQPNQIGLTANSIPEPLDPSTERLAQPTANAPVLAHDMPASSPFSVPPQNASLQMPSPPPAAEVKPFETLDKLEESMHSPHVTEATTKASDVDSARNAVEAALAGAGGEVNDPIAALNAQPLGGIIHPDAPAAEAVPVDQPAPAAPMTNAGFNEPTPGTLPDSEALTMPLPPSPFGTPGLTPQPAPSPFQANPLLTQPAAPSAFPGAPAPTSPATNSGTPPPPPVPPPMLPPLQ